MSDTKPQVNDKENMDSAAEAELEGVPESLKRGGAGEAGDRKSTRLNSSHDQTSYAVYCLKKKKKKQRLTTSQHTR